MVIDIFDSRMSLLVTSQCLSTSRKKNFLQFDWCSSLAEVWFFIRVIRNFELLVLSGSPGFFSRSFFSSLVFQSHCIRLNN